MVRPRTRRRRQRPESEIELDLFERGWKPDRLGGWTHARLETAWPAQDAIRLQDEADAGMQDKVHRQLRGEEVA